MISKIQNTKTLFWNGDCEHVRTLILLNQCSFAGTHNSRLIIYKLTFLFFHFLIKERYFNSENMSLIMKDQTGLWCHIWRNIKCLEDLISCLSCIFSFSTSTTLLFNRNWLTSVLSALIYFPHSHEEMRKCQK